ncbi:MAG: hypothetical protein SO182_07055 [Paludibacteraceae bacterium]|nr:hypothetical protein [Paludibacteraceae bacterium]
MMKHTKHLLVLWAALLLGAGNAWGEEYVLDQASLNTSKAAYQTSDYTHTATDGSQWSMNGFGIITTSPKHIQLGKASTNYIKTPICSGNITNVSITFAKASSYYVAIWDMDGNLASTTIASKPAANSTVNFSISGNHTQLQIIGTRTSNGTNITTSNAATYIASITVTYETGSTGTTVYLGQEMELFWNPARRFAVFGTPPVASLLVPFKRGQCFFLRAEAILLCGLPFLRGVPA